MDQLCIVLSLLFIAQMCCATEDSLKFLVTGDFGGMPWNPFSTPRERRIAAALDKIAGERNTSFQVELGDNFYFTGVQSVDDTRFQSTFEDVFSGENLQTPWYFIAGNHDHYGNVEAQILYTEKSERWNYPDYYYSVRKVAPDGATLDIVLLDTILLCGNSLSDFEEDNELVLKDEKTAQAQWVWLENELANSDADYLVVGGHFPVWSISSHGPTQCLIDGLIPLLYKYSATTYLCGHDHNSQHIQDSDGSGDTMDYFVLGSANFANCRKPNKDSVPEGSSKFFDSGRPGGFGLFEFNKVQMSLTIISGDNKELYYYDKLMPRNV